MTMIPTNTTLQAIQQESPNGLQIQYCGRGSKWGNPFRVVAIDGNGG